MKLLEIPFDSGNLAKKGSAKAPGILCSDFKSEKVRVNEDNIEKTQTYVYEKAVNENSFIAIGGDHSVSYPLIKAFLKNHKKGVVLYFDAHADADVYMKPPSYDDLIKVLFEDKILNNMNFAYIGLTKVFENEQVFIKKNKIKAFKITEIEKIKEFIGKNEVYVSIDIDVLNVKATGHAHGKADLKVLFEVLESVKHNIVCADIVEINPELGSDSVKAGKEILKWFMNLRKIRS